MGFTRPAQSSPTRFLFVANCGPAVGLSTSAILQAFASFGSVLRVQPADATGTRVIVSFSHPSSAIAARQAWNGLPCSRLGGRLLHIQYSAPTPLSPPQVQRPSPVSTAASELGIPGLHLYADFISEEEEQQLLAAVDERVWLSLSKRRVQHYGYEFNYKTRNVDTAQKIGGLPLFVQPIVQKFLELEELNQEEEPVLPPDQLTVNEYPSGVGLSPHVDTHSAFEGVIFSVSLAGPCIMEFRKHRNIDAHIDDAFLEDAEGVVRSIEENGSVLYADESQQRITSSAITRCHVDRKSIFLPQRSLLFLSRDARYGWQHYIPHHKADFVEGEQIKRNLRRVSFTFRKVRIGACNCQFRQYCDSQTLTNNSLDQRSMETTYGERPCIETADVKGDADSQLKFSDGADPIGNYSLNVGENKILTVERSLKEYSDEDTESIVAIDDVIAH